MEKNMENGLTKNEESIMQIDLMELVVVLLNYAWLLILVAVLAGSAMFGFSVYTAVPQYRSTTSIYMLINRDVTSITTTSENQTATQLIGDYEALISGRYVLEKVIEEENLNLTYNELRSKVTVSNQEDTRIILITVTDSNPKMAQKLANVIREGAAKHIKNVTRVEAVNTVDEANLPTAPLSVDHAGRAVKAALISAVLCAAIILLFYLLDDTIKTEEDAYRYLEISTLAMIPDLETENAKKSKKRKSKMRFAKVKGR